VKFAFMGSGGVGGYFGGRLAAKGHDVTFIARGAHLAAMRKDGLRIESREIGDVLVHPVQATDDPQSVGPVDYVVIAVKLWDTAKAGRAVKPMAGPDTTVVSLQNGVECNDILGPIIGPEHLIGGVAQIGSSISKPGVISHIGNMQRIFIGELDGGTSDRVEALRAAWEESGVDVEAKDDIQRAIWEKFVFLVGLSATTSLTRTTAGPIREDPDMRRLLMDVMAEVVAVARAKGVDLAEDYAEARIKFIDGLPADFTSSMHHDLERGNKLEVPWLSGAVARMADELGIDAPVNRVVAAALKPFAAERDG